jgi:hypothetical protein
VTPLPVHDWDSFYVIIGSSAAALTGLQFVVIALASESRASRSPESIEAFGTPTIVHFCAVLLIAAFISMPRHTITSLTICLTISGALGVAYGAFVTIRARRQRGYKPVLEDWIWHTVLPIISYILLFISGSLIPYDPELALYGVAGSALMLLFIGIHNAWDAAVYLGFQRGPRRRRRDL